MTALVTGSAGHLGEAVVRSLRELGHSVRGIDIKASPFTEQVGSIAERDFVATAMRGVNTVFHAATLHKPHLATHTRQQFIDTNITGTLNLLEEALNAAVNAFVFTSTTSVFGDAMRPQGGEPAVWVTEALRPRPKNIYGATKLAAENLCHLFHRNQGLNTLILRTSRFFPEDDDDRTTRERFKFANIKANEFLHRRVEIEDVVSAHLQASRQAPELGFGCYIISATTPLRREDLGNLRINPASVIERRVPGTQAVFAQRDWSLPDDLQRVYVNRHALDELGWRPRHDFASVIDRLRRGEDYRSDLARQIGAKGYHDQTFKDGPYPVECE